MHRVMQSYVVERDVIALYGNMFTAHEIQSAVSAC